MQLAPRPGACPDQVATPVSRTKKAAIAGAAVLGASAIAITPIAAGPNVAMSQDRDIALTAAYQGYIPNPVVTDDPGTVYNGIFDITVNNLTGLTESIMANPFPLLMQVGENQKGYLDRITTAFETIQNNSGSFFEEGGNGYIHGNAMLKALEEGDIFTAYQEFNTMILYSNTVASTSIASLFLSSTPRGSTTEIPGIPAQMAQNVADAVNTLLNTKTVNNGIFYSSWAAFGGVPYEIARNVSELSKAIQDQEFEKALNVVVNSPGMTVNALINGFDYAPDDFNDIDPDGRDGPLKPNGKYEPEKGETLISSWPGLLAPLGTKNNSGAAQHPGGLVYQALVGTGSSIAKSIDNDPTKKASLFSGSGLGLSQLKDSLKLDGLFPKSSGTANVLAKSGESGSSSSNSSDKLGAGLKDAGKKAEASVKQLTSKVKESVAKVKETVKKATSGLSGGDKD